MIASLNSCGILLGEWCGLELSVGINMRWFNISAFLHHFVIVPGEHPIYREVLLTPQPDRTNLTAFILTFGMFGFDVYMPSILSGCFQAIET
jgi:hypothetical protein